MQIQGIMQTMYLYLKWGGLVEPMSISLRPQNTETINKLIANGFNDTDQDGFYYIIDLAGSTSSIDIDQLIPGCNEGELVFDAIEIRDIDDRPCEGGAPGADIDAVCALTFLDCNGIPNGSWVFDDCGECLDPNDPNFNESCADCNGTPNGSWVIDNCGECLDPNDPNFNETCADCNLFFPNIFKPFSNSINDNLEYLLVQNSTQK